MMDQDVSNSRNSRPDPLPEAFSNATTGEASARPNSKIRQSLQKAKKGVNKKLSRFKHFLDRHPVQNIHQEGASLTPNIKVQNSPSGPEEVIDPQSVDAALRATHEAANCMNKLGNHAITAASTAQNGPAYLDTVDNIQDTYLKPLKIFISVIDNIANVHPYAKMALCTLSCAAKIVLAQANRDEATLKLLEKLGKVYDFMGQDDMLGRILSMDSILKQISQQTLECARFIRDYSETKNFWKRVGKNIVSETDDKIRQYNEVLDGLMQNFRDQVTRDVAVFVHRTGNVLDLSGMPYAKGAGLDTRKQCLRGTRREILSQITEWIHDSGDSAERVLWLSGPAGTGKSAIAHTIAKWFKDMGGLGSFYCFDRQRGAADRRPERVFSTIARDLADRDPEIKRALAETVQNDISLKKTEDISQQWGELLMKPLGKHSGSIVGPVVIVIDALDESGGVETGSDLLNILAGTFQDPDVPQITQLPKNFRFIVTSRPLPAIGEAFANGKHIRRMSMDEIPEEVAKRDIHTYVSSKLHGLPNFGEGEFAALAEKADGLFEWARLACEYIRAPPLGVSSKESFNTVVSRDPGERKDLLYDMYHRILTDIMRRDQYGDTVYKTTLARFCSVMGQILATAEPLPLDSLNIMRTHFPDESEHYEVHLTVQPMGSLLSGTTDPSTPIRPLHASFREFLTNKSYSGDFFVDVSKVRRDLAFSSLRVMKHELSFNICDLRSSYLPNCEDSGLPDRAKRCILPHLSYACRFWAMHVQTADFDVQLANEVEIFLNHERLLFWIETLSLINALYGAVLSMSLIIQWLKGRPRYGDLSSTATDVQRFIQIFGGIILHSTPHLYISALPFSPANSAMSRIFAAKFPNTLHLAAGRDMTWPAVQSVLSGHTEGVLSVSFSPDETRIATGSGDMTVRLWDALTGLPVGQPWRGHIDSVRSVLFAPDGTRIVTCSEDHTVRLWNAVTGQPVCEPMRGHTDAVNSVSFSPDSTLIATASKDHSVRLWDATTGRPVGQPLLGHTRSVNSVSFSPNGIHIVTGSSDHTVQMWRASTGRPVGEPFRGHADSVNSVSFSPDGTLIATGSSDSTVRLWNATTRERVGQPLRGHTRSVKSVSFSQDGTCIATCSDDSTVRLWDVATGQPRGEPLLGHTDSVNSVSFSRNGTRIVTGSSDHTVRLWDATTGQPVGQSLLQPVGQPLLQPVGRPLREPVSQPLQGHKSVSFSWDGARIATGSLDHTVRLWNAVTGQPVGAPLRGHTDRVNSVSFSPDGTRIATGSSDYTVRLWNAKTGQPVGEPLWGHTYIVKSVSFSPDSTRIATGSSDHTIQLWDTATGQRVGEPLLGHTDSVNSVSFSPDGSRIVTGSEDCTVRLWDSATRQPIGEPLRGHTRSVNSASFSPDGTRIVTGSEDKTVRLWDTVTGQPVGGPLWGHTDSVNSVSFSPEGTRIVTGSKDNTVRLWNAVTWQPIGEPLRGHTHLVSSVSFSPDGTRIVSCSEDKTIRLWHAGSTLPQCTVKVCSALSLDSSLTDSPTENSITMATQTWSDDSICFSSSLTHALCDAAELIEGASYDYRSTSLLLKTNGWMIGPSHRLLFWVPHASRDAFVYNPRTALIIPGGGCVELDLSRMAHGQHWQLCRVVPDDNVIPENDV